ncbi:MAG: hypothetical protein IJH71_11285 [Eubacterium sp.]|nr:hypothetical protein [Eubacterium sp.]
MTGFLKPYKEKEYYFAGLLPNEGYSVESVLSEMSAEEWSMLFWKARRAKVDVKIPEYRFEYEKDLSGILNELGVSSAFDQTRSNLQNMITIDGSYVEGVVQKSYIEVSRKGTRAAVITGIIAVAGCILEDRYEVYLDRPFIFAIYQSHTGIPVFIGVVKTMDS